MPLNDRDLQALRHLVTQVKRIADALDTPAEEVDAPLPPDNGARIIPRVMLPGAEEHAQAFQNWLHDNTPKLWPPYKMCSASIEGAFGRPLGPCVLRYQHDGPVHLNADGTTWAHSAPGFRYERAVNGWMWICRCGEADGPFADEADAAASARTDHPDCSAPAPAEVRAQRSNPTP